MKILKELTPAQLNPAKPGAWLIALGYEITPGECTFCGAPVRSFNPKKPALHCRVAECRRKWWQEKDRYRYGTAPRTAITAREHVGPRLWLLTLECGHQRTVKHAWAGHPDKQRTSRCAQCRPTFATARAA